MYVAEYDRIIKRLKDHVEGMKTATEITGKEWVDTMNRYKSLRAVLERAFRRAAFGKGNKRHSRGDETFDEQYIIRGATSFGIGGLYFQIGKKLEESVKMVGDERINELLDIIIYSAAAIMITEGAGKK
jgi:hypothetical protein